MKSLLKFSISTLIFFILFFQYVYAWGNSGHKLIHRKAVIHLPEAMSFFKAESLFFQNHSIDANSRINYSDTSLYAEWPRHYFYIDDYPNAQVVTRNLDSLIMIYGRYRVQQDGTNPWATKWFLDSLTNQLARGDIQTAMFTASDLGHYVADIFQPLHCTINSDGQFSNNHGIHSRYEYGMIDTFKSVISIHPVSVQYISSAVDFAFSIINTSRTYINQILLADSYSKLVSGWNGIGIPPRSYYDTLWYFTRGFTKNQFQNASVAIANLWYTAWVNSGMNSIVGNIILVPKTFTLAQNYPNPFNPKTKIFFQLQNSGFTMLKVYDGYGKEVGTLLSENKEPGNYEIEWHAGNYSSGTYYYRITVGNQTETKKCILIK